MRHATFRPVLVIALVLLAAWPPGAHALEPVFQADGLAIRGYDPVEYFAASRAANREAFLRTPERYAPRYGGYCAYAVSRNYTASVDPTAWRIVDGKLYLNYSHRVQRLWEQDVPGNIEKGDRHWPEILGTAD